MKALKDMIRDSEEFLFPHGPKGDQVITSKMLAYKTLHRKRGNGFKFWAAGYSRQHPEKAPLPRRSWVV